MRKLIILIMLLLAIVVICVYLFLPCSISYEFIANATRSVCSSNDFPYWCVIRNNGYHTIELLSKDRTYTKLTDWDELEYLLDKNDIYVVCYGCSLRGLTYTNIDFVNENVNGKIRAVYNASAIICPDDVEKVNIYKVTDRITIEHDIHTNYEYTYIAD